MSSYNTYESCVTECICFNCKNRGNCHKSSCVSCIGIPDKEIQRSSDCYDSGYFTICDSFESIQES